MWAKSELRAYNRKIRNEMSPDLCRDLSERICENIVALPEFSKAESILLYHGIQNEVNTDRIFRSAIAAGKKVYYPKSYHDVIRFFQVKHLNELHPGAFHVCEPSETNPEFTDVKNPCIIVVPGLAFSRSGHRIGYGKGYYDRFLSSFTDEANNLITTIGIGYHFQFAEEFQEDTCDYPLNLLMDEHGMRVCT